MAVAITEAVAAEVIEIEINEAVVAEDEAAVAVEAVATARTIKADITPTMKGELDSTKVAGITTKKWSRKPKRRRP